MYYIYTALENKKMTVFRKESNELIYIKWFLINYNSKKLKFV